MHDMPLNQAAGLIGLTPGSGVQITAMVSHGDARSELPLLWQLCESLVDLGYSATVLDATQDETHANPGLQQLLEYRFGASAPEAGAPQWSVLPAAQGIHNLCHLSAQPARQLHSLGALFAPGSVVILYAGAQWLVRLLAGSGVRPMLSVSGGKTSLLTSYLALKRLLLGQLEPTILNMMDTSLAGQPAAGSVAEHLSACARTFLGYEVNAVQLQTSPQDRDPLPQLRRLATRMLESALQLPAESARSWSPSHRPGTLTLGRSH
jgi:hypothetical protein